MIEEKGHNIKDINNKSFILKKAEKLAQAVYRVTDVLNDRDNLKWETRTVSVQVFSEVLSFVGKKDVFYIDKESLLKQIIKIASLLQIIHGGTLLAQNNFLILKKEYEDLEQTISKMYLTYERENLFVITESDLTKGADVLASLERASIKDIPYKGQEMSFITSSRHQFATDTKRQIKPSRPLYSDRNSTTSQPVSNSERQEAIVRFVKDKKEVSIKDILSVQSIVKSASEKTIQRELLRLVAIGVLNKVGERRWSRYSLPK
jgi:hypothetical protein